MSQNTLIEKIKDEAAKAVSDIASTGATKVENIQRETEAAVTELKNERAALLQKKEAQMELVAIAKAKQAAKIASQQTKRDQVNALFSEVHEELEGQSADSYTAFFLKYAKETLPSGIIAAEVEAPAGRLEETKSILSSLGLTPEVKAKTGLKAGLVVKTKEGVYDLTLDRLMGEKRADLEMKVVTKAMG